MVDFDGNLTQNSKGYIGDVDVFREFLSGYFIHYFTNGNETFQLTADVGLTNVVWYDSTNNTQVGTGSILNIVGTEKLFIRWLWKLFITLLRMVMAVTGSYVV